MVSYRDRPCIIAGVQQQRSLLKDHILPMLCVAPLLTQECAPILCRSLKARCAELDRWGDTVGGALQRDTVGRYCSGTPWVARASCAHPARKACSGRREQLVYLLCPQPPEALQSAHLHYPQPRDPLCGSEQIVTYNAVTDSGSSPATPSVHDPDFWGLGFTVQGGLSPSPTATANGLCLHRRLCTGHLYTVYGSMTCPVHGPQQPGVRPGETGRGCSPPPRSVWGDGVSHTLKNHLSGGRQHQVRPWPLSAGVGLAVEAR